MLAWTFKEHGSQRQKKRFPTGQNHLEATLSTSIADTIFQSTKSSKPAPPRQSDRSSKSKIVISFCRLTLNLKKEYFANQDLGTTLNNESIKFNSTEAEQLGLSPPI
jgi:hypothetical protein